MATMVGGHDPVPDAALPRAGQQIAAARRDPFPHADQPVTGHPGRPRLRSRAPAVVADLHPQGTVAPVQPDPDPLRVRVLDRVGQRLLHHPVRGDGQFGGDRTAVAVLGEARLEPGPAGVVDQAGQVIKAGLRGQVGAAVVSQHAERTAELPKRVATGRRDGVEGGLGLVRLAAHDDRAGLGLHHHQADRVGEHVVHVPGDPGALPGRRGLVCLGQPASALLEHHDPVPAGSGAGAQRAPPSRFGGAGGSGTVVSGRLGEIPLPASIGRCRLPAPPSRERDCPVRSRARPPYPMRDGPAEATPVGSPTTLSLSSRG
jgi:hypothetical protein